MCYIDRRESILEIRSKYSKGMCRLDAVVWDKIKSLQICVYRRGSRGKGDTRQTKPSRVSRSGGETQQNSKVTLAYLNVQSVRNKTFKIREYLGDNPCDVFALSETWLKSSDGPLINEISPQSTFSLVKIAVMINEVGVLALFIGIPLESAR